jgi:hypothetical protein
MLRFAKLLLYLGYCSLGVVVGLLWLNPAQYEGPSTAAVMTEYATLYCRRDTHHDRMFQLGGAAAISRIVVKADLGKLAQLEYVKCKLQG